MGTACTVPPGSIVTVTPANAIGLNASNPGGAITANGITVNLAAATTIGARALAGATISFDGSTLATTAITTATSAGQIGLQASGSGSRVSATGASLTLGPPNGTTVASNMIGANAIAGGTVALVNTNVRMLGGATGQNNHALFASGTGSSITFENAAITTGGVNGNPARAELGGSISLTGATISSSATSAADANPASGARIPSGSTGLPPEKWPSLK
ncbi:flagellar hook-length control protein FliK [Bosea sp. BIWAKO-01]|nr:flagellar hook-length control protein FliK [Bosea sp. BIWAKO-01]